MTKWQFFWNLLQMEGRLQAIDQKLDLLLRMEKREMAKIDDLKAAVARNTDAEQSVIVLLQGIAQQLRDAQGDPAKIDEVIAQLDANNARLAAAVTENTPAA